MSSELSITEKKRAQLQQELSFLDANVDIGDETVSQYAARRAAEIMLPEKEGHAGLDNNRIYGLMMLSNEWVKMASEEEFKRVIKKMWHDQVSPGLWQERAHVLADN